MSRNNCNATTILILKVMTPGIDGGLALELFVTIQPLRHK